jgi:hypothetical protein
LLAAAAEGPSPPVLPPALKIVTDTPQPSGGGLPQNCSRCRSQSVCWKPVLDDHAIVINLLVCRIHRRIDVNKSAKTLLQMIRPKLIKSATKAAHALGGSNVKDLVRDFESVAIESLMSTYLVGESIHPLRWLFGEPNGAIPRYAFGLLRQARIRGVIEQSMTTDDDIETHLAQISAESARRPSRSTSLPPELVVQPAEHIEDYGFTERVSSLTAVIEDGATLSAREYRVLSFCLYGDQRGAHFFLGDRLGLGRQAITHTYAVAVRRVIQAAGLSPSYLQQRKLRPGRAAGKRRQKILRRQAKETYGLTVQEIIRICQHRRDRVSILDIAWAYGVTEDTVRDTYRRYGMMAREEIESALVPSAASAAAPDSR